MVRKTFLVATYFRSLWLVLFRIREIFNMLNVPWVYTIMESRRSYSR